MIKRLMAVACALALISGAFTACSGSTTDDSSTDPSSTQEAAASTAEDESRAQVSDDDMYLVDLTAYERKADTTLVKQTALADIELKQGTDKDGKRVMQGTLKADAATDNITVSVTYGYDSSTGIIRGRVFSRADGNSVFECNYRIDGDEKIGFSLEIIFE